MRAKENALLRAYVMPGAALGQPRVESWIVPLGSSHERTHRRASLSPPMSVGAGFKIVQQLCCKKREPHSVNALWR
jgi:hypothetical protein